MDTFTVRDLRERTGELIRDAEVGKLLLVTKHGQPVFLAVPFDETLVKECVRIDLAIRRERAGDGAGGQIGRGSAGGVPENLFRVGRSQGAL